jgi:hypothetical protein
VDTAPLSIGTLYRVGIRQKQGTGSNAILEAYLAEGDAAFGAPFAVMTSGTGTTPADRLVLPLLVVDNCSPHTLTV